MVVRIVATFLMVIYLWIDVDALGQNVAPDPIESKSQDRDNQNILIYNNNVIIQSRDDTWQTKQAIEKKRLKDAQEQTEKNQDKPVSIAPPKNAIPFPEGHYLYQVAPDGCYKLINELEFCTQGGTIVSVIKAQDPNIIERGHTFGPSVACNIAIFRYIQEVIIKKTKIKYHEYQIKTEAYPTLIKLIVFPLSYIPDRKHPKYKTELLESIQKSNLPNLDGSLVGLVITPQNQITCLKEDAIFFYKDSEAFLYAIRVPKYGLVGPMKKDDPKKKITFIQKNGPYITYYNLKKTNLDDQ